MSAISEAGSVTDGRARMSAISEAGSVTDGDLV